MIYLVDVWLQSYMKSYVNGGGLGWLRSTCLCASAWWNNVQIQAIFKEKKELFWGLRTQYNMMSS